jgi:hypothetical protein
MDVPVIEMDPEAAEQAFKEYREAVRSTAKEKYAEARNEYERLDRAIMRGYKEIAKGNSLLRLSDALRAGGVEEITWKDWEGKTRAATFPRLAIARADARHVFCAGVHRDGTVIFHADDRWSRRRADQIRVDGVFDEVQTSTNSHRAIVPTIPPPLRPPHKLSGYHILWEAEWDLSAPVDPMLLKHLGGELYAVLAVWDLTELEQAVLGGMRA